MSDPLQDALRQILADADQADAQAEESARAAAEKARAAFAEGWQKGLAGLLGNQQAPG